MESNNENSRLRPGKVFISTQLRSGLRRELKIAAARDGQTVEEKLDSILCEHLGLDPSTLRPLATQAAN